VLRREEERKKCQLLGQEEREDEQAKSGTNRSASRERE
jgi:hypothetical protein